MQQSRQKTFEITNCSSDETLQNRGDVDLFLSPEEVEQRVRVGSPFIEDILINGLILYDRDETFQGIRGRMLKAKEIVSKAELFVQKMKKIIGQTN